MEHGYIFDHLNYWVFIFLMMLGLWAMISKKNLIKKIMGMGIFQSSIILFYVSIAAKDPGASIPIYPHDLIHPPHASHELEPSAEASPHGSHEKTDTIEAEVAHDTVHSKEATTDHAGHHSIAAVVNPDDYDNPLPHVLMLTAIVVGVATLGVALALVQRIFRIYGTIEEDEVLAAIVVDASDGLAMDAASTSEPQKAGNHA